MMVNYPPPLLSPDYINILIKSQRLQKERTLYQRVFFHKSVKFNVAPTTLFDLKANWQCYVMVKDTCHSEAFASDLTKRKSRKDGFQVQMRLILFMLYLLLII